MYFRLHRYGENFEYETESEGGVHHLVEHIWDFAFDASRNLLVLSSYERKERASKRHKFKQVFTTETGAFKHDPLKNVPFDDRVRGWAYLAFIRSIQVVTFPEKSVLQDELNSKAWAVLQHLAWEPTRWNPNDGLHRVFRERGLIRVDEHSMCDVTELGKRVLERDRHPRDRR